jgi:hypothetical protein
MLRGWWGCACVRPSFWRCGGGRGGGCRHWRWCRRQQPKTGWPVFGRASTSPTASCKPLALLPCHAKNRPAGHRQHRSAHHAAGRTTGATGASGASSSPPAAAPAVASISHQGGATPTTLTEIEDVMRGRLAVLATADEDERAVLVRWEGVQHPVAGLTAAFIPDTTGPCVRACVRACARSLPNAPQKPPPPAQHKAAPKLKLAGSFVERRRRPWTTQPPSPHPKAWPARASSSACGGSWASRSTGSKPAPCSCGTGAMARGSCPTPPLRRACWARRRSGRAARATGRPPRPVAGAAVGRRRPRHRAATPRRSRRESKT